MVGVCLTIVTQMLWLCNEPPNTPLPVVCAIVWGLPLAATTALVISFPVLRQPINWTNSNDTSGFQLKEDPILQLALETPLVVGEILAEIVSG